MPSDLRTQAIVLRRTNYGESDRIINFLTPDGKVSALARGVRKERSRLAGGIELFSVADIVVHQGHSSLATLTGAKMLHFYSHILTDLARLELAANFLKRLDRLSEQVSSPEHFQVLQELLAGLNDPDLPIALIETWGLFNLFRLSGEELNLVYDVNGEKLNPQFYYRWEASESALRSDAHGNLSAREIKFARLLLSHRLAVVARVDDYKSLLPPLLTVAKTLNRH